MGLFGKKEEIMPAVADIFSAEDLKKINDIVAIKMLNRTYGRYNDMAETLMQVVVAPEKAFTKREWNDIIYASGGMTKLEPDLAPTLKDAIKRFHSFKKK